MTPCCSLLSGLPGVSSTDDKGAAQDSPEQVILLAAMHLGATRRSDGRDRTRSRPVGLLAEREVPALSGPTSFENPSREPESRQVSSNRADRHVRWGIAFAFVVALAFAHGGYGSIAWGWSALVLRLHSAKNVTGSSTCSRTQSQTQTSMESSATGQREPSMSRNSLIAWFFSLVGSTSMPITARQRPFRTWRSRRVSTGSVRKAPLPQPTSSTTDDASMSDLTRRKNAIVPSMSENPPKRASG
jgi:hypothetical protein